MCWVWQTSQEMRISFGTQKAVIWSPEFPFSPQVPQFHSFSRKNQSESPFQVYFAYGSCKKHIISTIFQHFGAPRPKIWTLGHQKSPPVHWLWSLREALPDWGALVGHQPTCRAVQICPKITKNSQLGPDLGHFWIFSKSQKTPEKRIELSWTAVFHIRESGRLSLPD